MYIIDQGNDKTNLAAHLALIHNIHKEAFAVNLFNLAYDFMAEDGDWNTQEEFEEEVGNLYNELLKPLRNYLGD